MLSPGPTPEEIAEGRRGELDDLNLATRLQLAARSITKELPRTGIPFLDAVLPALRGLPIRPPEFLLAEAQREFALRNSLNEIVTEVGQLQWRLQALEMMPAAIEGVSNPLILGGERFLQVNTVEDFIRIYMEPGTNVGRDDVQWAARLIAQIQQEKRIQEIPPLSAEERSKLIIQVQTNRSATAV